LSADDEVAATLHQHGVAGTQRRRLEERVPGRDARAGQRRRLLEGEVGRHLHPGGLGEHDLLRQHPVDRAAERAPVVLLRETTPEPGGEERGGHAIADGEARDAGPDLRHLAGPVRGGHHRRLALAGARQHAQVAVVERDRPHAHADVVGAERPRRPLDHAQRGETLVRMQLVCLHLHLA